MMIYTGNAFGDDLQTVKKLKMGIMICTSIAYPAGKDFKEVPCAMDNGAFTCFQKGYPFQSDLFRDNIKHCHKLGIPLDFITCPDIVCGGDRSLMYSVDWALGELITAPKLALVIQDGMTRKKVLPHIGRFTHLFIGGSVDWKWKNAQEWVQFAHDNGLLCHIGQVGQLKYMLDAYEFGADSIDSTSMVRNKSWDTVVKFHERIGGRQNTLFTEEETN